MVMVNWHTTAQPRQLYEGRMKKLVDDYQGKGVAASRGRDPAE